MTGRCGATCLDLWLLVGLESFLRAKFLVLMQMKASKPNAQGNGCSRKGNHSPAFAKYGGFKNTVLPEILVQVDSGR